MGIEILQLLVTEMLIPVMMSENQSSQSQVHVTAFWGTEGLSAKKATLNRQPSAYKCRGGWVLTQHQSRDMETDGQSKTLTMGHQAHPEH